MTLIERAARAAYEAYDAVTPLKQRWDDLSELQRSIAKDQVIAVLTVVRDNTPSPRTCDELTRILKEAGRE